MKLVLTIVVSTAVMGLAMLLSPAAALACKPQNYPVNEHCYGEAYWNVEGKSGSGFKGLDAILGISEEALYAWEQEGDYNFVSDEAWVSFEKGEDWNESGEMLGCNAAGCTPAHEDRWFWYDEPLSGAPKGAMSPEGSGAEEWEVTDKYEPSIAAWYVKSKNWTTDVYGQPSWSPVIVLGTEITTNSSLLNGGAKNLDWEDLQGKWHYSDWASGSSHAGLYCVSPAKAAWIEKYKVVGFGSNIEFPCDNEASADLVSSPTGAGEQNLSARLPSFRPASASSATVMMPDLSATGAMGMSELKVRATAVAANLGDPDPSSIEVAKAPRAQAIAAVTPGMSFVETGKQPQWLNGTTYAVVLHGHFERPTTRTEEEVPSKPYTTLSLVIDARTGEVNTFSLNEDANPNQEQPVISQLGDVGTL